MYNFLVLILEYTCTFVYTNYVSNASKSGHNYFLFYATIKKTNKKTPDRIHSNTIITKMYPEVSEKKGTLVPYPYSHWVLYHKKYLLPVPSTD